MRKQARDRMRRGGCAYRRGRRYVLMSQVHPPDITRSAPPCFVLPLTASDVELGAAARAIAAATRLLDMVPAEHDVVAWNQEIFDAVGVRDWIALERNAKLVTVDLGSDGWTFTPMRRQRGGWIRWARDDDLPATRPHRVDAGADDATVGAVLREALSGPTPSD